MEVERKSLIVADTQELNAHLAEGWRVEKLSASTVQPSERISYYHSYEYGGGSSEFRSHVPGYTRWLVLLVRPSQITIAAEALAEIRRNS